MSSPSSNNLPQARTQSSPSGSAAPGLIQRLGNWLRPKTRVIVIANLIGQILIVLTGGLVRLTASGLGCTTWPLCTPGNFTPELHAASTIHPYVEFGNRAFSFVLLVIAVLVFLVISTDTQRSAKYRRLAWIPMIGVIAQAVIGGILVLVKLPPALVGFHLLLSIGLIIASAYLVHREQEGDGKARPITSKTTRVSGWLLVAWMVPVYVLGVIATGAGPHSGDNEIGYRFAVDPAVISKFHAMTVWVFLALLAWFTWQLRREQSPELRVNKLLITVWLTVLAQGVAGYVQYFNGLPWLLVAVHMLLAATLSGLVMLLPLRLRIRN